MEAPRIEKPSYTLTRRAFWASFWFAWLVIIALMVGALYRVAEAVSFGAIAVPSMVLLIASQLGIHRFSGAMDMRTIAETRPDEVGGQ